MRASALLFSLTSVTGVASLSIGNVERDAAVNGKQCSAIRNLVSYAGTAAQSTATAFCSSYLGIKTSTVLSTTTSISTSTVTVLSTTGTRTITASAVTATSFTTSTETDTTSTIVTSTVTTPGTGTTTIATPLVTCAIPAAVGVKRAAVAASPKPKPSCFKPIPIGAELSSACSCLSIPTPKSTSVVTVKGSTTVSTTSNVLASATITPSTTIISTIAATTTSTSSSTVTVTVPSSLSTVTVTGPFKMLASGGGGTNGHYGVRTPARDGGEAYVQFRGDILIASSFYLRADNALLDEQFLKLLAAGAAFLPGYDANQNNGFNLVCTPSAGPSCLLTCQQYYLRTTYTGNYNVPNPYDSSNTPADWWGLGVDRAYDCFDSSCVYQKFDIYAVGGV